MERGQFIYIFIVVERTAQNNAKFVRHSVSRLKILSDQTFLTYPSVYDKNVSDLLDVSRLKSCSCVNRRSQSLDRLRMNEITHVQIPQPGLLRQNIFELAAAH